MKIKSFDQRFCPVVNRNVAVEYTFDEERNKQNTCLNEQNCQSEYGGCKYSYISRTKPPQFS